MTVPEEDVAAPARGIMGRLATVFREFGLAVGTLYLVDRALNAVSPSCGLHLYDLMVQPILEKSLLPKGLSKNLRMEEIGRGHPDMLAMPAIPAIKERRLDKGAICLATYRKGALIGYIWFLRAVYDEDEVRCTYELSPSERSVFDFGLYVPPEHRLGIAFAAVWDGANRYLGERGIAYTFSRVTRFNLASRRSHARFGWKRVGRAMFLRFGRLELLLADIAPFVAISWSRRVRLRLDASVLGTPGARESRGA